MAKKLTTKQEAFKNNRIKGMGVSESYRSAYNCGKMSDKAVSVEANKLEKDPRVALEIKVNRQEATERAIVTTEDIVRGLLIEAQTNGEGSTQSARVAAWKALSDFTGGFDANKVKTELTGANGGPIDTVTRVERVIVDTSNRNG
jgi:phage terminase small subunit